MTIAQKIAQHRGMIVTAMNALQKISREELEGRNTFLLGGIVHLGKACNELEVAALEELKRQKKEE